MLIEFDTKEAAFNKFVQDRDSAISILGPGNIKTLERYGCYEIIAPSMSGGKEIDVYLYPKHTCGYYKISRDTGSMLNKYTCSFGDCVMLSCEKCNGHSSSSECYFGIEG